MRNRRNRCHERSGLSLVLMLALAGGLAAVPAGCTPWATYPTVQGSFDMSNPALTPIPELMSMAIRETSERDGGAVGDAGGIVFNLPPRTPPGVYDRVIELLGGGRPMREVGEPAIHVIEVRVRAVESEVDVIHLTPEGHPQEMTIAIRQNLLRGFRVASVRPWNYRVVMPPPNFDTGIPVAPQIDAQADEWVAPVAWDEAEQAVGADASDPR